MFTHDYVHVLTFLPSKQGVVQGSVGDNFAWIAWELVKMNNHSCMGSKDVLFMNDFKLKYIAYYKNFWNGMMHTNHL
jgi:hypothetical protein